MDVVREGMEELSFVPSAVNGITPDSCATRGATKKASSSVTTQPFW